MADIDARWIYKDSQSLMAGTLNVLQVKVYASGGLERSANGLQIKAASVTDAMLAGSISFAKLADNANIARLDQTESVAAVWSFGTNLPTVTADPTTANQLTRKSYVDALYNGLKWKASARALAVSNITLSGTQTIDGVATLVDGDRILLTAQSTSSQNGIWIMRTSTWERPADFAAGASGSAVALYITEGTVYADTEWFCTTDAGSDTVGTDALAWAQKGGSLITAGDGLSQTGNAFAVNCGQGLEISGDYVTIDLDGTSLAKSASGLAVASGGITFAMIASAAIGTTSSTVAAGNHDHGASGASASQYWGLNASAALGWWNLPDVAGGGRTVDLHTITATDITNKYFTLSDSPTTPSETMLFIKGAGFQYYGDDYVMDGGYTTRLGWSGLDLDGVIAEGDKVVAMFN